MWIIDNYLIWNNAVKTIQNNPSWCGSKCGNMELSSPCNTWIKRLPCNPSPHCSARVLVSAWLGLLRPWGLLVTRLHIHCLYIFFKESLFRVRVVSHSSWMSWFYNQYCCAWRLYYTVDNFSVEICGLATALACSCSSCRCGWYLELHYLLLRWIRGLLYSWYRSSFFVTSASIFIIKGNPSLLRSWKLKEFTVSILRSSF